MIKNIIKSHVGSVLVIIVFLISSFVFNFGLDAYVEEYDGVTGEEVKIAEKQLDHNYEEGTLAPAQLSLDDVHGGSWVDSFRNDF